MAWDGMAWGGVVFGMVWVWKWLRSKSDNLGHNVTTSVT